MAIHEVNLLLWTPLFGVFYYAVLIVYRIYFHPLAKIPGPKLAAATTWYEFYYNVIGNGIFCWEIKRMHDKYGWFFFFLFFIFCRFHSSCLVVLPYPYPQEE